MRALPVLALALAASGCGGALATPPGSDGGSMQTTSPPAGSSVTETALATAPATGTYVNSTTAIEVEPNTGTAIETSSSENYDIVDATVTIVNPASCTISTSNYDQSCADDFDCAFEVTGNLCDAGCPCQNATFNMAALPQYYADYPQTPLEDASVYCDCPYVSGPCCRQGQCTLDCVSPADTLPACADAGGSCIYGNTCDPHEPPNSCAYADETCCPLPPPSPQ